MNLNDSYKNPFAEYSANVMDPETILNYWCSPFDFLKFAEVKESNIYSDGMPIVFIGGRGTGKTMFLKYYSFSVQIVEAIKNTGETKSVLSYFKEKGGIGFYLRIDGPKLRSFKGSGVSKEKWLSIFTHYFELVIGRAYIKVINDLFNHKALDKKSINEKFIPEIDRLFGNTTNKARTISDVLLDVDSKLKEVDDFRADICFSDISFKPTKAFSSKSLSFTIPKIAKRTIPGFEKEINFILMIDEYENFLTSQQRIVNTLLKFVEPGITFRLGMRTEGFREYATTSKDDFIREGRDYRKIVFEEVLIKDSGYKNFLRDIARKRLEEVQLFSESGFLDIKKILGNSENLEDEAIQLTKSNPGKHFHLLKDISSEESKSLEYRKNPLMEMLNILWVSRKVEPDEVCKAMEEYLSGEKTCRSIKYRRDYVDKYKLSLMILLSSIYRKHKLYYSFNTFSFLSSGIVGYFIELCRKSFQYAEFENKEILLQEGKILPNQQHKAAIDTADTELQMIQRIEDFGDLLYRFILNLGNMFRDFHKDKGIKYPETNQFSVDKDSIEEKYRAAFNSALKWAVIQKKHTLQPSSPGKHVKDIYIINRIFSPRFDISYRTRGGYSVDLTPADIKKFMTEDDAKRSKRRNRTLPEKKGRNEDTDQLRLDFNKR